MKQVLVAITAGSFILLLLMGSMAFKNPIKYRYWAIAVLAIFLLGTIGLGVMENSQLTSGGWLTPGGS